MRVSTKHSFLVAVILGFILINEGYGFMKGPCKKKRWSKCHSVTFNIVKRSDSPLSAEFDNDITEVDWRDILKRRNGGTTTQKLLQILKDLRADIVAEIKFKNEK